MITVTERCLEFSTASEACDHNTLRTCCAGDSVIWMISAGDLGLLMLYAERRGDQDLETLRASALQHVIVS
jgi:hypothetical protein